MDKINLTQLVNEIKQKISFDELFREFYPEHFRQSGNSICPFHEDHNASFAVHKTYGKCHAGCKPSTGKKAHWDIFSLYQDKHGGNFWTAFKALGDRCGVELPKGGNHQWSDLGDPVAFYDYHDAEGNVLFRVERYATTDEHGNPDKTFLQCRPDGRGGWIYNLEGVQLVLFGLPELLSAEADEPVLIVEGEKDVLTSRRLGFTATCNPMGAGKWPKQCKLHKIHEPLGERICWVIPDEGDKGQGHAVDVASSLRGFARSVKLVQLPNPPPKGDLTDFVEAIGDDDRAREAIFDLAPATPEFEPSAEKPEQSEDNAEAEKNKFNKLRRVFQETGSEVFLDQHNAGWACLKVGDHHENLRLLSPAFYQYLLKLYVGHFDEGIGRETIKQVAELLQANAEDTRDLYNRFASIDGKFYIDLSWPEWEVVEVTASGWRIVRLDRPPFRRFTHQKPLPKPRSDGDVHRILDFVPLKDRASRTLYIVWLVALPLERIPRPGLLVHGVQGSCKTSLSEFSREPIDPSSTPTLSLSKDNAEFVQLMDHHALINLDNLQRFPQWASDSLCRAVTGSGFLKRKLYTDDDDMVYRYRRTFILNGINIPGSSPDLLDRSILIEMKRVEEEDRREIEELRAEFDEARPFIFGGILDALVKAMTIKDSIRLHRKPRMADWTVWGCAIADALGIGQEQFLEAYYANIGFQHEEILNSEPICVAILEFMKDRDHYEDTPTGLHSKLAGIAADLGVDKSKRWPKAANALTPRINQFSHNLAQTGIEVTVSREGKRRAISLTRKASTVPEMLSSPSHCHESNNSNTLDVTARMTVHDGSDSAAVTDDNDANGAVTSDPSESQTNDSSDSNDSVSGNSCRDPRMIEWGCLRCNSLDEAADYIVCRFGDEIRELTDMTSCPMKGQTDTARRSAEQMSLGQAQPSP